MLPYLTKLTLETPSFDKLKLNVMAIWSQLCLLSGFPRNQRFCHHICYVSRQITYEIGVSCLKSFKSVSLELWMPVQKSRDYISFLLPFSVIIEFNCFYFSFSFEYHQIIVFIDNIRYFQYMSYFMQWRAIKPFTFNVKLDVPPFPFSLI